MQKQSILQLSAEDKNRILQIVERQIAGKLSSETEKKMLLEKSEEYLSTPKLSELLENLHLNANANLTIEDITHIGELIVKMVFDVNMQINLHSYSFFPSSTNNTGNKSANNSNELSEESDRKQDYQLIVLEKSAKVTVLHSRIASGENRLGDILNEYIKAKTLYGETPLHWAAQLGKFHFFLELLGRSAKINEPNTERLTPLECAMKNGNLSIVRAYFDSVETGSSNYDQLSLDIVISL